MNTTAFFEILGHYSREIALEQGYLLDVSDTAKQLNYPCGVAISTRLFELFVKWSKSDTECQVHQDQALRLKSLLIVAKVVAQFTECQAEVDFIFNAIPRDGFSTHKVTQNLRLILEQDENKQPVATILLKDDLHQALINFKALFPLTEEAL